MAPTEKEKLDATDAEWVDEPAQPKPEPIKATILEPPKKEGKPVKKKAPAKAKPKAKPAPKAKSKPKAKVKQKAKPAPKKKPPAKKTNGPAKRSKARGKRTRPPGKVTLNFKIIPKEAAAIRALADKSWNGNVTQMIRAKILGLSQSKQALKNVRKTTRA